MPALGYALGASTGPVLEVGIGNFSAPFLHEFCKASRRSICSLEENGQWHSAFRYVDQHGGRVIKARNYLLDIKELTEVTDGLRFGVSFVDSSPGGKCRADLFKFLIECSEYVVVHDYHRENEEAIKPLLEGVNFRVFNDYNPPTLLASKSLAVE